MGRERSFVSVALHRSAMFIAYEPLIDQTLSQKRSFGVPPSGGALLSMISPEGGLSNNIPLLKKLPCILLTFRSSLSDRVPPEGGTPKRSYAIRTAQRHLLCHLL